VRQRSRPAVWARPDRPRGRGRGNRGPQPSLTVEVIVDAAIAIADAEGVDAVSMRRIAGQLGAGTMSLYRYVATKDDLLDLMADQISGDCGPLDPPEPGADWRDGLRADAVRTRQVLLAHPWAGPLLAGRPMLGRQSLRRQEYLLRLVDGRGLGIDEMAAAVGVVTGYVRGVLLRELAEREVARRTGLGEDEWRAYVGPYVRELMADGDFPLIERYMVEGEDHPDPDAAFLSGLESVLDGVAARLARAA
jgi:AcrR family transcriptional regulator